MQPISKAHVRRMERFLEELRAKNPKIHHEIDMSDFSRLMTNVGFYGPEWKAGSIVGFSHDLLKSKPFLTGGQFTVHIVHAGKAHRVRYRDFKKYVIPFIEEVLSLLEQHKMILEDDPNVQI